MTSPPPPPPPLPFDPPPPPPEPEDSRDDVVEPVRKRWRQRSRSGSSVGVRTRRIRRLRWPLLIIGLLVVGASLGHMFIPRETAFGSGAVIDPAALEEAGSGGRTMPSLLGLNIDVARQVLADAGLETVEIRTEDRPAAGPAGSVVTQEPAAGTGDVSGVSVALSSPILVPDIIGASVADARTQLEEAGAVVQIDPIIDPTLPASTVREVYPPVGSAAPLVVRLTVVDVGDALTLASVGTVASSGCSTVDTAVLGGTSVGSSVSCTPGSSRAGFVEYALSRSSTAMDALVGTDDRGGTGSARVRILGDGRELVAVDVALGLKTPIRIDTRDVLRLRIEVTGSAGSDAPDVVLGDARLMGTPAGLDLIAAQ